MKTLPIHERFHTFQGEGCHAGRAAFFVRLYGCPVQCPWCDSAGTWHPSWVPKDVQRMPPEAIVDEVVGAGADRVVVTGGEPAIHDLSELSGLCNQKGIAVHLETSGAFEIKGHFDWITLSPKKWKMPLEVNVRRRADEFKIIVEEPDDIGLYYQALCKLGFHTPSPLFDSPRPIWLHPEWSQRENPSVLNAIAGTVKAGSLFRAGYQIHRLYLVDAIDERARQPVPLGGELKRGY